jgi:hypothetical protein
MYTVVNHVDQFDHQTILSNRTVDRWWGCHAYYCVLANTLATIIVNTQSIKSKNQMIWKVIDTRKPEIVVVSETWTLFEEEEVCLIRIKEQVGEKRSTVCTHLYLASSILHISIYDMFDFDNMLYVLFTVLMQLVWYPLW